MRWRRNPDNEQLKLEREYRNSGSIYDAAKLLSIYVRTGQVTLAEPLLALIAGRYAEETTPEDLSLEAAIISAHIGLGGKTDDLCKCIYNDREITGSVICQYDKTVMWDVMRGQPIGTTQSWIDSIGLHMFQMGWVGLMPTLFEDTASSEYRDRFEAQSGYLYAVALFHDTWKQGTAMLRVHWRHVTPPRIKRDQAGDDWWAVHRPIIMLEDEPISRDYPGPKVSVGNIRTKTGSSMTKRVPLQVGMSKALETIEKLAYKIYFGTDDFGASGTTLYWPE